MPNRILKESICTSDSIDGLGWFEEVLFYRLIVNCDDFGRFDGRPAIIKNRLFPLKETLTVKAVTGAINKLASAGLVTLYVFEGKPYLYLPTWNYHQTVRAKRSKYPAPEDGCESVNTSEIICNQMNANVPVIQSNPNPIRIRDTDSGEQASPLPAVIGIPLNDGSEYPVTQPQIDQWKKLYPAVDVMQELREMVGWSQANKTKRKTKSGVMRFITGWLSREQDKGKLNPNKPQKETSMDLSAYEDMVSGYIPVYERDVSG